MPERLEVTLTPKTPALRAGQPAEIDVAARYLYGAPGAEPRRLGRGRRPGRRRRRRSRGSRASRSGSRTRRSRPSTAEIEEQGTTDAQGRVDHVRCRCQELAAPRPTRGEDHPARRRAGRPRGRAQRHAADPAEGPGGRACARTSAATSPRARPRPSTSCCATPDGTRLARQGVVWSLCKVERRYQWFNSDGRWGFEPVKSTRRVADGRIDVSADRARAHRGPGRVGHATASTCASTASRRAQTSVSFTVGWSGDQTADTPDLLDMTLDKASYGAGDTHPGPARRRASPARRRSRSSATRCTTCRSSTSPPTARR